MKNILIRRVDNLGDIILVMPALKLLCDHFRNANITLMVRPEHRVLVKQYADNFLGPVPVKKFKMLSASYDHCINIEYSLPEKFKLVKKPLPKIMHVGGMKRKRPQHISRVVTHSLKEYGIKGSHHKQKLVIEKRASKEAALWFRENNILPAENLIVSLDPNSGFEKKSWLLSRFIKVSKYLIKEFNAIIIIPTSSASNERVLRIKNSLPAKKCFVLAGKPLDEVASVLKKCDIHVGNDSGIGHLASAVGTPTVTIFGPTDPFLWKPTGRKSIVVLKPETECPGGYEHAKKCEIQKCLISITAKEVIDGILYVLTKYVSQQKLFSLTDFKVSENLTVERTSKGYLLQNSATKHVCLVNNGWLNVKNVLKRIKETDNIKSVLIKQPHQKPLINMLIMHRLLEPSPLST